MPKELSRKSHSSLPQTTIKKHRLTFYEMQHKPQQAGKQVANSFNLSKDASEKSKMKTKVNIMTYSFGSKRDCICEIEGFTFGQSSINMSASLVTVISRFFPILMLVFCILPCVDALAFGASPPDKKMQNQLEIAFVTGNEMKVRELSKILTAEGLIDPANPERSLVKLRVVKVDLPEIQEVDTEGIAKDKVLLAAQLANGPAICEDTSLEFHALGGQPGPFIKFFQDRLKSEGLWRILTAYEDKSATAVCTLAFCTAPHADPVLFTGRVHGTIVEPIEGRGFGWDSIFVPEGEDQPFSCLSTERKNELSHRGDAVRQWAKWLLVNKDELIERQNTGRRSIGHKGLDFKSTSPEQ
ncbi:xanthosine triphosphate pyrophosphatase [Nitzschia inconspicua]|uniref:XTP/dITP diphosphatase n=1 Tax=Nitzschia inconspicua TaxID=303405 RepID=A0A9K3M2X4_9STRA|nr:xanthosine triphosphate pyrophosphatase [Nitzschia inconspicua]